VLEGSFSSSVEYWVALACQGSNAVRQKVSYTRSNGSTASITPMTVNSQGQEPNHFCIGSSSVFKLKAEGTSNYRWAIRWSSNGSSQWEHLEDGAYLTPYPQLGTREYQLSYTNSCGYNSTTVIPVSFSSPVFTPNALIGPTLVCAGSRSLYSSPGLTHGSNGSCYQYTVSGNGNSIHAHNQQGGAEINWGIGFSGVSTVTVTAYNQCSSASRSIQVQVNAHSPAVGGTVSGSVSVPAFNNQGSLTLSGYTGTITGWQKSENGGSSWMELGNAGQATFSYADLSVNTQFRAALTTTGCGGSTAYAAPATITTQFAPNWVHTRLFNEEYQQAGVSADGLTYFSADPVVYPVAGVPATVKRYISPQSITLSPGAQVPANTELEFLVQDGSGVVAENRVYTDYAGNPCKARVVTLAPVNIASQPLYGRYGQAVGQTLPAPVGTGAFEYQPHFVTRDHVAYNYKHFNLPINDSPFIVFGSGTTLNAPLAVDNSTPNTLGWYYSNNNGLEPYVAETGFPYSRTEAYGDGSGEIKRSSNVGDALRMGQGKETLSGTFPVINELADYLAIRNTFFTAAEIGSQPTSLRSQAILSVGVDANGVRGVSFTDKDGKLLMTAWPGNWLTVNNAFSL